MIRIITTARLRALERAEREAEGFRVAAQMFKQQAETWQKQAEAWEQRASKFIDQIGCRDGILSAPAMQEPTAAAPSDTKRVMSILNRAERRPTAPDSAAILGVSERAVSSALDGLL